MKRNCQPAKTSGLSRDQLAETMSVDVRTVRRWEAAGCPNSGKGATRSFVEADVRVWLAARGRIPGKEGKPGLMDALANSPGVPEDVKQALLEAELRKRTALARRHEMLADQLQGKLLKRIDVERGWEQRIVFVRTVLSALAGRIGPILVGKDQREIERTIAEEIRALLEEVSRG